MPCGSTGSGASGNGVNAVHPSHVGSDATSERSGKASRFSVSFKDTLTLDSNARKLVFGDCITAASASQTGTAWNDRDFRD
jgi:hypothetical protein